MIKKVIAAAKKWPILPQKLLGAIKLSVPGLAGSRRYGENDSISSSSLGDKLRRIFDVSSAYWTGLSKVFSPGPFMIPSLESYPSHRPHNLTMLRIVCEKLDIFLPDIDSISDCFVIDKQTAITALVTSLLIVHIDPPNYRYLDNSPPIILFKTRQPTARRRRRVIPWSGFSLIFPTSTDGAPVPWMRIRIKKKYVNDGSVDPFGVNLGIILEKYY